MGKPSCETCAYQHRNCQIYYCDYLMMTGRMRGCPPGPACTRWLDKTAPEAQPIMQAKQTTVSIICPDSPRAEALGQVDWSIPKARQLWDAGYPISKIEGEVNAPKDEVRRYINLHPQKFPKEERERNMARLATDQAEQAAPTLPPDPPHERKSPGRKVSWNVETAIRLYAEGIMTVREIAKEVGANYNAVQNYITRHPDQFTRAE